MCGIVGLYCKSPELEPRLGEYLAAMLVQMSDRGPDSAGVAVYRDPAPDGCTKLTLYSHDPAFDWSAVGGEVTDTRARHAVVLVEGDADEAEQSVRARFPELRVMSAGRVIEIYKEVGPPRDFARQFRLHEFEGTHGLGHTRMATESRVTTEGSHPFSTGRDLCLVHNGSLSNHNRLREQLRREGLAFQTENDTEVAAAYLTWRLREGDTLADRAGELPRARSTASTPSSSARPTGSRCCGIPSPASRPCWPRPTTGSRWRPSTARSPCCPARRTRRSGSPSRRSSTRGRRSWSGDGGGGRGGRRRPRVDAAA